MNHHSLTHLLKTQCISISKCKQAHAYLLRNSLIDDPLLVSNLISFLSLSPTGDLAYARTLFFRLTRPNIFTWNTIICGHARGPEPAAAFVFIDHMLCSGVAPDHFTYPFAIFACARLRSLEHGMAFHAKAVSVGLMRDVFVVDSTVRMYANCECFDDARKVFDESPHGDVASWNAMITRYVNHRSLAHLLKNQCTSISKCKQAHAYLLRNSLIDDPLLVSHLISFLSLSPTGDLAYARTLFFRLSRPDIFIWNTIIRAHACGPEPAAALVFFCHMLCSGVAPDHFTYPSAIFACTCLRSLEHGMTFHAKAISVGLMRDVLVVNSTVKMYANCECFDDARRVFDESPHRDAVSWNVMITGYVNGCLFQDAFDCFERMMEERSAEPDSVTLMGMVSACSQSGDLERGRWLHCYSEEKGSVKGNLQLGNAIVDMYCKCGDLTAARKLFDEMDGHDVLTWHDHWPGECGKVSGVFGIV